MPRIFVYEYLSGGGELADEAEASELLPPGISMRDALVADLLQLPDVSVSCAVCARPGAGLHEMAGAAPGSSLQAVQAEPDESATAFVARMADRHDLAWVVAPESGCLLAELQHVVGPARWVGCSAEAIRVAGSKSATLAVLSSRGVPTPLSDEAAKNARWIVKPDDGAGAMATRVHPDRDSAFADFAARGLRGEPATLEPFVEGEPMSISVLVGPGFVRPLAFNRQLIEIAADGQLHYRGVQRNAIDRRDDPRSTHLHLLALDVVRALPGLAGFVGIDLVWHAERGPFVIEVNPRVTCAYVGLSAMLGRNLAGEILLMHDLREHINVGA